MKFTATDYGYEFRAPFAYAHFSFGSVDWQQLPQKFPEFSFDRVKQVHGDSLVESRLDTAFDKNGVLDEADALFTCEIRRAVTVASADCLPVLILNPDTVLAIHAGWRGVKNEIILKSLQKLGSEFCEDKNTIALIGPHILQKSFEVDRSLAEEFQQQYQVYRIAGSDPDAAPEIFEAHPSRAQEKAYVNLKSIAAQQLLLAGLSSHQIHFLDIDTMTDQRFASYRRDKGQNIGRNFSFASRL